MYAEMGEVDQIIGNDLKLQESAWGLDESQKVHVNDIMTVRETAGHLVEGFEGHSRAFLQVQNGCDHRCIGANDPSFARPCARAAACAPVLA